MMSAFLYLDQNLIRKQRKKARTRAYSESDLDLGEEEQSTLRRWGDSIALNKQGLHNASGLTNHIDFKGSTTLSEMAMLGTHDAGTYAFSKKRARQDPHAQMNLGRLLPGAFKCQSLDLPGQALEGARYFDVRVTQKHGVYQFFHGPSGAGNALEDVNALLAQAAQDTGNLYAFKFDFKEADDYAFLEEVTQSSGCLDHLITKRGGQDQAGNITLAESIYIGRNILFMVKDTKLLDAYEASSPIGEELRSAIWSYKENVQTKWGNTAKNEKLAAHILKTEPAPPGKIPVTQTNKPFMNPKKMLDGIRSVKKGAQQGKFTVANAVLSLKEDKGINPGVISLDYLGDNTASATEAYKSMANTWNKLLEMKGE